MEEHRDKLKNLLNAWPEGAVFATSWMNQNGYSNQLLSAYKRNGWVVPVGTGAVVRSGSTPTLAGAMYALQSQLGFTGHFGGKTALGLHGQLHDVPMGIVPVQVFYPSAEKLPKWFTSYEWESPLDLKKVSLFTDETVGLTDYVSRTLKTKISSQARAMLELLHVAETDDDLRECFELMQGLKSFRPKSVQELLEKCTSIKAKRLFMYFAEQAKHFWIGKIDKSQVNIGTGKRVFASGDKKYVGSYLMSVPKTLSYNNGSDIQESG